MLILSVKTSEGFDNVAQKFVYNYVELKLEHSLVSLSKWEQKYEKPFLTNTPKTIEETIDYLRFMALEEIPEDVWTKITGENMEEVNEYLNRKMTATWFNERGGGPPSREQITAELIYYWMTVMQIDWQAQYWHLNTLLTLVKVCNHKSQPPKKQNRAEAAQERARINAERLAASGSRG